VSALVEIVGVTKRFGAFTAVKDVSMEVAEGQVVCIIGPSGSGKSTLLRCINHLEAPDHGFVRVADDIIGYRVAGEKLYEVSDRELARQRSRIGMVFQQFNLFPHMTALQNVTEGPVLVQGKDPAQARTEAMAILERVGLGNRSAHYPAQLSGGQQQRVAIARALALRPSLVLFDEPTSSLDPELVGEVLQVMRELAMTGLTMIVVTHEIGFAREVADKIVFMDGGRIVETGTAQQVLMTPTEGRTKAFLAAVRE